MSIPLRKATACTLKLGPFVDDSDGKTPETELVITKADVRLSRNGGAYAAAHADQGDEDAGAPHEENGEYAITLDAADTDTVGRLKVLVVKSGALPVWEHFEVLSADAYDARIGGTGTTQTTLVIQDADETPLADVDVWVSTDPGGANVVAGKTQTNAAGQVVFMLDPGTYYRWCQKSGVNFMNPREFTV